MLALACPQRPGKSSPRARLPQHSDKTPDRVVMDWGFLSGAPKRNSPPRTCRSGRREAGIAGNTVDAAERTIGQPIVSGNKLAQNHLASRDEERFIAACGVDQLCEIAYELLKPPRENVHSCSPFYQSHCMNMAM